MDPIPIKLIDPGGEPSAQLVDPNMPLRELIAVLVARLDLPKDLDYVLFDSSNNHLKDLARGLIFYKIGRGDEIRLVVSRSSIFAKIVEKLIQALKRAIRKKLWEEARRLLRQLKKIHPNHPETPGLESQIEHPAAAAAAPPGNDEPPPVPKKSPSPPPIQPQSQPQRQPPPISASPPPISAAPPPPPPGPAPAPPLPPAAAGGSGSGAGCFWLGALAVVGALVFFNWGWVKVLTGEVDGVVTAKEGSITVKDHNIMLDFAYVLYLNGERIGLVENPAGGETRHEVEFRKGENRIELRYDSSNDAIDTALEIIVNDGEFSKEFVDPGNRQDFEWTVEGVSFRLF